MSILRVHRHRRDFTITVNATPRDKRLSARARGVLWFLLTQQDGYPVNAAKLAEKEFPEGRDAIAKAIRELVDCGYLTRRREQDQGGLWRTFTDVYETPNLPSGDGFSGVGDPPTGDGFSGVGDRPSSEGISPGRTGNGFTGDRKPVAMEKGLLEEGHNQRTKTQPHVGGAAADVESPPIDAEIVAEIVEHPEAARLCDLLADEIQTNTGNRPNVGKRWLDAARLLLDRDGLTPEQVTYLIRWSQADEFWRSNILSMPKLREKRDTLILRIKAEHAQRNGHASKVERRVRTEIEELLQAGQAGGPPP
jgi:hypothetical protein